MSRRLFDYDPLTGQTQYFEPTADGGFSIITTMDVEPIIEGNKAKQAAGRDYYARDPEMWRVGSIPTIVLLQWATELGIPPTEVFGQKFTEIIARRLKSSDWRAFKTADINI